MAGTVIEAVRRSFAVLEALGRRRNSTVAELTRETGLPRPTLIRLLHTLIALGYAQRISRQLGYRPADRVLNLAGAIRFVDHLVDAAIPHMTRFTREHGWPLYLATLSHGSITVRYSTAPESPMAFEGAGLNVPRPLLISALGRALIAFCPEEERRAILREAISLSSRQQSALEAELARIRRAGYAFTASPRRPRIHGIAVPIRRGRRVLGSLSMRFPRSSMTEEEVASRYGRRLQALARAIARDTA